MKERPIQIHTKITQWRWYKDANTKSLFLHLIITACQSSCIENEMSIQRGQRLTTYRELAEESGLSLSQTRTSVKKLFETGEIDLDTTKRFTLITLLNYESYQQRQKAIITEEISENNNRMFYKQSLSNMVWVETMCMQNNMSSENLKFLLDKFMLHLQASNIRKTRLQEFTGHFNNWIRYQKIDESSVPANETYIYTWRGMHEKSGNFLQFSKDKKSYDHPGFDFKLIKILRDE